MCIHDSNTVSAAKLVGDETGVMQEEEEEESAVIMIETTPQGSPEKSECEKPTAAAAATVAAAADPTCTADADSVADPAAAHNATSKLGKFGQHAAGITIKTERESSDPLLAAAAGHSKVALATVNPFAGDDSGPGRHFKLEESTDSSDRIAATCFTADGPCVGAAVVKSPTNQPLKTILPVRSSQLPEQSAKGQLGQSGQLEGLSCAEVAFKQKIPPSRPGRPPKTTRPEKSIKAEPGKAPKLGRRPKKTLVEPPQVVGAAAEAGAGVEAGVSVPSQAPPLAVAKAKPGRRPSKAAELRAPSAPSRNGAELTSEAASADAAPVVRKRGRQPKRFFDDVLGAKVASPRAEGAAGSKSSHSNKAAANSMSSGSASQAFFLEQDVGSDPVDALLASAHAGSRELTVVLSRKGQHAFVPKFVPVSTSSYAEEWLPELQWSSSPQSVAKMKRGYYAEREAMQRLRLPLRSMAALVDRWMAKRYSLQRRISELEVMSQMLQIEIAVRPARIDPNILVGKVVRAPKSKDKDTKGDGKGVAKGNHAVDKRQSKVPSLRLPKSKRSSLSGSDTRSAPTAVPSIPSRSRVETCVQAFLDKDLGLVVLTLLLFDGTVCRVSMPYELKSKHRGVFWQKGGCGWFTCDQDRDSHDGPFNCTGYRYETKALLYLQRRQEKSNSATGAVAVAASSSSSPNSSSSAGSAGGSASISEALLSSVGNKSVEEAQGGDAPLPAAIAMRGRYKGCHYVGDKWVATVPLRVGCFAILAGPV